MVSNTPWSTRENSTILRLCRNPGDMNAEQILNTVNEVNPHKCRDRNYSGLHTQIYTINRKMKDIDADWDELSVPDVVRKASADEKLAYTNARRLRETPPTEEAIPVIDTPTPPRPAPQTTLDAAIEFNWELYVAFGQVCKVLLDRAHYLEAMKNGTCNCN